LYGRNENYRGIRFPFGILEVKGATGLVGTLYDEFKRAPTSTLGTYEDEFDRIVITETSSVSEVTYAYDRFSECTSGWLILRDYGRVGSADEREHGESRGLFPHVTLEGHALILK
jgi:hypothetical protein